MAEAEIKTEEKKIPEPLIVACLGARGGSGKSTLAHMLALGAADTGRPVVVFETDPSRPSMASLDESKRRPYTVVDGINREDPDDLVYFARLFNKYYEAYADDGAAFIIDGAAAREEFDAWIAASAQVILVSAMATEHDMLALQQSWPQLAQHNVHIILTRVWQSPKWMEDRASFIERFPAPVAFKIPQHEAFAHLTDSTYRYVDGALKAGRAVWAAAEKLSKLKKKKAAK